MHRFPQTNLQLYRHLAEVGYAAADIASAGRAYELALELFPGTYRGSGKPFLAHLVGTAGIVAGPRTRAALIATGVLHPADCPREVRKRWPGISAGQPGRRSRPACIG